MNLHQTPDPRPTPVDLLVLVGGRGERLGGADKATLEVGGTGLLDRLLTRLADGDEALGGRVVVVGLSRASLPAGVLRTVEEPEGSGPVAGIAAGLDLLDRSSSHAWVAVAAVDQPGAAPTLLSLREQLPVVPDAVDAIAPYDRSGRRQWLLAIYRRDRLRAALARLERVDGAAMRELVEPLRWMLVTTDPAHLGDVDTWEDHRAWQERLGDTG